MRPSATRIGTGVLAACFCSSLGCDTPPGSTADDNQGTAPPNQTASAEKGIKGTELYRKNLGRDHAIYFYELSEGRTAIRESLSGDGGEKELMETFGQWRSLAEVYDKLNPGGGEVPLLIREADQRAALRALEPQANEPQVEPSGGAAEPSQAILSGAQASCSSDRYGDGWSGSWFISNYCNAGAYRSCDKNWGWADSGEFRRPWASWRQMEGDFNVSGHIRGTIIDCHWYGCDPRKMLFDYDVLPRRIEVWNFGGTDDKYSVFGTSPCGHLHRAWLRN